MRRRSLLAMVVAAFAAAGPPAEAHEGNPNYRSEITTVEPEVPGLGIEVVDFDDSLRVQNETGETIIVPGYEGEPYVRIGPGGTVEINVNSPTHYLNQDRFGESAVPDRADPTASPDWRVANESGQYSWHDHRIHYMGQGTPAQVETESTKTTILDYEVPLLVGDQRVQIAGTLYWVGQDEGLPTALFIALGSVVLLVVVGAFALRSRRRGNEPAEVKEVW